VLCCVVLCCVVLCCVVLCCVACSQGHKKAQDEMMMAGKEEGYNIIKSEDSGKVSHFFSCAC
jgi:hypothetical protein